MPEKCPRCGGAIPREGFEGMYPGALSRVDGETEICSDCGTREALYQFAAGPGALLPPVTEAINIDL